MLATILMTCCLAQSPADDAAVALALAKAKRERLAVKADAKPTPAAPSKPATDVKAAAVTKTATDWVVTLDGRDYSVPLTHDGHDITRETAVAKAREVHAERGTKAAKAPACPCGDSCQCLAGECGGAACPTAAAKAAAAPNFRTEYRTRVTGYVQQCNGNGTCRLVPQTVTEAVQVPVE